MRFRPHQTMKYNICDFLGLANVPLVNEAMFRLLLKTMLFITYVLTCTRSPFSTLLLTCGLQNVSVANVFSPQSYSPSGLLMTTACRSHAIRKIVYLSIHVLHHWIGYAQLWAMAKQRSSHIVFSKPLYIQRSTASR